MRKMEFKEVLFILVEYSEVLLYMINQFVKGESFNNFALSMGLENLRMYIEELHDAIN